VSPTTALGTLLYVSPTTALGTLLYVSPTTALGTLLYVSPTSIHYQYTGSCLLYMTINIAV